MQGWLPFLLLVPLTIAKKGFYPNEASVVDHQHLPFYERADFLYITIPAATAALLLVCCVLCCTLYARHGVCHLFDFPKNLQTIGDDRFLTIEEFLELERRQRLGLPVDSLLALDEQRRAEAEAEAIAADPFLALAAEAAAQKATEGELEEPEEGDQTEAGDNGVHEIPGNEEQSGIIQADPETTADSRVEELGGPEMADAKARTGPRIGLPLPLGGADPAWDTPAGTPGDSENTGTKPAAIAREQMGPHRDTPNITKSVSLDHPKTSITGRRRELTHGTASDPALRQIYGGNTVMSPTVPPARIATDPANRVTVQFEQAVNGAVTPDGRYLRAGAQSNASGGESSQMSPAGITLDVGTTRWDPANQINPQSQGVRWIDGVPFGVPLGWPVGGIPEHIEQYDRDGRRLTLLDIARNARGYSTTPDGRPLPPQSDRSPKQIHPHHHQAGLPGIMAGRAPPTTATDPRQVVMTPAGPRVYTPTSVSKIPISSGGHGLQYEPSSPAQLGPRQPFAEQVKLANLHGQASRTAEQDQNSRMFDHREQTGARFDPRDAAGSRFVSPGYAQTPSMFDHRDQLAGVKGPGYTARGLEHPPVNVEQSVWARLSYEQDSQVAPAYKQQQIDIGPPFDASQRTHIAAIRRSELDGRFPLDMTTQNGEVANQQRSPMTSRRLSTLAMPTEAVPEGHHVVTGPDGQLYLAPTISSQHTLYQSQASGYSPRGQSPRGIQSPRVPSQTYFGTGLVQATGPERSRIFEHPSMPVGLYGLPTETVTTGGNFPQQPTEPHTDPYSNAHTQRPESKERAHAAHSPESLYQYNGKRDRPPDAGSGIFHRVRTGSLSRMSHSLRQLVLSVKGQTARSRSEEPADDITARPRGSAAWLMDRIRSLRGVSEQPDQFRAQEFRRRQRAHRLYQRKHTGSSSQSEENLQAADDPHKDLEDGEYPGTPQPRQRSRDSDDESQLAHGDNEAKTRQRSTSPQFAQQIKQEPLSPGQTKGAPEAKPEQAAPVQYVLEEHNGKKRIVAVVPRQATMSHRVSSEEEIELKPAPRAGTKRRKVKPRLTARSNESLELPKKKKSKAKKKKKRSRKRSASTTSSSENSSDSSSKGSTKKSKKHKPTAGKETAGSPSRERAYSENSYMRSDADDQPPIEDEEDEGCYRKRSGSRGSSMSAPRERSESASRETRDDQYPRHRDNWSRYQHPCRPGYHRHKYQQHNQRSSCGSGGYHGSPRNNGYYNRRHSPIRGTDGHPPPWTQTDLNRHGQPRRRPVVFQNESLRAFVSLPPRARPNRGFRGRPCDRGGQRGPPYRGRTPHSLQTNQSFMQQPHYSVSPPKGAYPCRPMVGPRTPPLPRSGSPPTTPPRPPPRSDPRLCAGPRTKEDERVRETQLRRIVYGQSSKEDVGCTAKLKQMLNED